MSFEVEENGFFDTDDLGLRNVPPGIIIWEGVWEYYRGSCDAESEVDLVGSFRQPTVGEWKSIKQGKNPWNQNEYYIHLEDSYGEK